MASRLPLLLGGVKNLSEFSRASGVSRRMLDRYKAGMEPSLSAAVKIARALGLPLDALVSDAFVSGGAVGDSPSEDWVKVPILSVHASAGAGSLNYGEHVIDEMPFSRALLRKAGVSVDRAHFITARGDSMLPNIPDGAYCLVDGGARRLRDGEVYALVHADDVRIKRVRLSFDGGVVLSSDNPAKGLYPDDRIEPEDVNRLNIAGRVFWVQKKV